MEGWGCYSFQWGGCDGNMNNFGTKEDCMRTCKIEEGGATGKTHMHYVLTFFFIRPIFNNSETFQLYCVCVAKQFTRSFMICTNTKDNF